MRAISITSALVLAMAAAVCARSCFARCSSSTAEACELTRVACMRARASCCSPKHHKWTLGRYMQTQCVAVYFLLHLPSGFPDRALPGTLPCGARTFLPSKRRPAIVSCSRT